MIELKSPERIWTNWVTTVEVRTFWGTEVNKFESSVSASAKMVWCFIPHLGAISRVFRPWVTCPILTTVVPGFSGNLIGCTIRSKWGPFGDLYLARKNLLCVWNNLFVSEIKFSQRRTLSVKSMVTNYIEILEIFQILKNIAPFNLKLFYQV